MNHPNELDQQLENLRTLQQSYDQLASDLQAIKDAHILGFNYDGLIFAEGFEPQSAFGIVANRSKIVEVHDNSDSIIPSVTTDEYPLLTVFEMRGASSIAVYRGIGCFYNSNALKEIIIPEFDSLYSPTMFMSSLPILRHLNILNAKINVNTSDSFLSSCPQLIDVVAGKRFSNADSNETRYARMLINWSPTDALDDQSNSLLTEEDITAGFTNNLQKLLYNIREHIAANLVDRTGQSSWTIGFSADVKAAIQADTTTSDAFTNKNWTIA